MTRSALVAVSLLLCVACSREQTAPESGPAAGPQTTVPTPAPIAPAAAPAPAAPMPEDPTVRFDKGSFAGTFTGDGMSLDLRADGTYVLEAPGGGGHGAWSHEPSSNAIRLDPGSKTEPDRVFRMTSRDALARLGADGQPVGQPLRRQGAG